MPDKVIKTNTGNMSDEVINTQTNSQVTDIREAVRSIKAAILKSQARAAQMVNHEQLSLYYGIGRYISEHSREGYWGTGAIARISKQLKAELPGLKGFSEENIKLMRRFYEAWKDIENKSVVVSTEIPQPTVSQLPANSVVETTELQKAGSEQDSVRQLQLTNDESFPITAFLNISFTHHVAIFRYAETYDERKYYIQLAYNQRLKVEELEEMIKASSSRRILDSWRHICEYLTTRRSCPMRTPRSASSSARKRTRPMWNMCCRTM